MGNSRAKEAMQNFAINQALKYIEGNPEENIPKLMALVDKFSPADWYTTQRSVVRKVIEEKSNWYQLILRVYDLDPDVRKAFFRNFLFNASLKGSAPGRSCSTPPPPATCTAPAAGPLNTATA